MTKHFINVDGRFLGGGGGGVSLTVVVPCGRSVNELL